MKLKEAIERRNDLTNSGLIDKTIPVKLSYSLGKNYKWLSDELKYYEDERLKLCKLYSEKDEKGEPITITSESGSSSYKMTDENRAALSKDLEELLEMEIEDKTYKIKESVFEDYPTADKYAQLTSRDISNLYFMIEENNED